jgi:hypothetical protein
MSNITTKRCISESNLDLLLNELEPKDIEKAKINMDSEEQEVEDVKGKSKNRKVNTVISNKPDYIKSRNRFLLNESGRDRDKSKKKIQSYKKMKRILSHLKKGTVSMGHDLPYIRRTCDLWARYSINECNIEFVDADPVKKIR